MLAERFQALGLHAASSRVCWPSSVRQIPGHHVLARLARHDRGDWLATLERAVRFFGAYSLAAVERILAATAQPRSILACLAEQERQHLEPYLRDDPVAARPTADYQHLLTPETSSDAPPPTTPNPNDSRSAPDVS